MEVDKRRNKRIPVNYEICCRQIGDDTGNVHHGRSVNASPSGLYFRTNSSELAIGSTIEVELSLPPKSGQVEKPARVTSKATVIRKEDLFKDFNDPSQTRYGIAVEFTDKPKLAK